MDWFSFPASFRFLLWCQGLRPRGARQERRRNDARTSGSSRYCHHNSFVGIIQPASALPRHGWHYWWLSTLMVPLLASSVPRKTPISLQGMLLTSGSAEFIEELKRQRDAVMLSFFAFRLSAAQKAGVPSRLLRGACAARTICSGACVFGSCCTSHGACRSLLHGARCVRQVPLLVSGTTVVHGERGPGHVTLIDEDDPRGKPVHVRQLLRCDGLSPSVPAPVVHGVHSCHVFTGAWLACHICTATEAGACCICAAAGIVAHSCHITGARPCHISTRRGLGSPHWNWG
jgi:hypothetical protein